MRTLGLSLSFLALTFAVEAKPPLSDWQNLDQLKPGDRIEILLKSKATHRGTFAMLAEDAITLRTDKGETGFRRDEVSRVSALGAKRRGRAAVLGLVVGTLTGLALGAVAGATGNDSCNPNDIVCFDFVTPATGAAVMGVTGAAVGAGVGVVVARPARTEIYRAP